MSTPISPEKKEKNAHLIDRSHPFCATIKEKFLLTQPGSTKHTSHISLDLTGSGLVFKAGDSLGVFAQNDPLLVQHLLNAIKATGDEEIVDPRSGTPLLLREFLTSKANLSRLTSSFLKLFYEQENDHDKKNRLQHLLLPESRPVLSNYLTTHDPLDLLKEYQGISLPLQELCNQFSPLLPRFYSIASSFKVFPNEVHLTVALFSFIHDQEKRFGVASHFLCHLAKKNKTPIPIYVQPSSHFTLPKDPSTPIIMVGPGTGIAPFRAFLQERTFLEAPGKNWLFFGERNQKVDFFYEDFWKQLVSENKLRLDVAFSRDQPHKIYVQHRMLENAAELWRWLEEGASFYVCGDAAEMAKEVETALLKIFQEQGRLTEEGAKMHLKQLRLQRRYLLDVY